ncbi:MAG: ATP-dependent DNA helicase RecG, partial [Defluviitaleaceae bacterium]|nr:ATP-dependent DNA helicase RecG [Defluviitaleaceae bacterium]
LPGVGAKRAHALNSVGIFTVADLLEYFPRDYDDRSKIKTVAELIPNAVNTIRGVVSREPESATFSGKLNITKLHIHDHTGTLEILWFNQPYMKKNFKKGDEYIFTGKVREIFGTGLFLQMQSPEYESVVRQAHGANRGGVSSATRALEAGDSLLSGGRIVPIYTPPKGFSQKMFRKLVFVAVSDTNNGGRSLPAPTIDETLPSDVLQKYALCDRGAAIRNIHFPESDEKFFAARRRLVFEELYLMQVALFELKNATKSQVGIFFADTDFSPFLAQLPFKPTAAQSRVLEEISADITGGTRMNRLLQGDVGSGKTAIAFASAYLAAKNGFQAAIMAPTDVLATQHFDACEKFFTPLGIPAALLTGSLPAKSRRAALEKIADGTAKIIIGTHALIQDAVEYHNLALCITDEQHRFGVNQRLALVSKAKTLGALPLSRDERAGRAAGLAPIPPQGDTVPLTPDMETARGAVFGESLPHVLVMSATPIPRTLGLILYGDLDVSIIDELPPGRVGIKTYCVNSAYRARLHAFIKKEAAEGRQAYVICPAIEEGGDEKSELKNVENYTRELTEALPGIRIAHLHGRMKPTEKQAAMDAFKSGEVQVIVSTTVIEVGVHVANASLIIVENAERFGLSQLHQLRGRVGRGTAQSYCILVTDSKNENTAARTAAMTETTDGFRLAELDLEQRGAGDFFGTRQHGLPTFKIANLYRDLDILKEAQAAARNLYHLNK